MDRKIVSKHDFAAKLCQPSLLPYTERYVAWQRARREAMRNGTELPENPEWLMPVSINLDLTTSCNYQCDHCIDWEILNRNIRSDHDKLIASLDNMIAGGLRSVILIGGGEPTLYPKFGEVVRFLKERGLRVAVVSNGSRNHILYDVAECFGERDWLRFSLDAATDETFLRMHKPKKPVPLREICAWVPKIRVRNPNVPVGFSFIVVWEGAASGGGTKVVPNIHEMVQAARLAHDFGFSYISFKPFLTRYSGGEEVVDPEVMLNFDGAIRRIRAAVEEAKKLETDDFKILESTNLAVLEEKCWRDFTHQPRTCHMQAFHQVLSPLGLYNCPGYRGVEKARIADKEAYRDADAMTESQRKTVEILDRFDASHECRNVTCLFNSANWLIEKAITGELNPGLEPSEERGDYYF